MASAVAKKKSVVATADLEKLSKPEARVAIARDVLSQLRSQKLVAESGNYCYMFPKGSPNELGDIPEVISQQDVDNKIDLQDIFKKKVQKCEVCAKGALFVSMVRKYDNVPIPVNGVGDSYLDGTYVTSKLRRYFSGSQLELIEYAFELGTAGIPTASETVKYNASSFCEQYDSDKERMIAIMKNIIKNEGTFIPPKASEDDYSY